MSHILIIDDEAKIRTLLARIIRLEGFEVSEAATCAAGLAQLTLRNADVILCDVKLPDGNGIELAQQLKALYPATEIILLTAYGTIPDSVQAMRNGAFDYLTKGDDNNRILPLLYKALEKATLNQRVAQLEKRLSGKYSFDTIIGNAPALQEAIRMAQKVAGTSATVLLTGESGTGKEVFANAIHQASPRSGNSFVAINCAAFSKEMLEGELFGHKAGAFTGAVKDQKGLLEAADGGTLFLDEIGEMPTDLQTKLLRALESGSFLKIGSTKPVQTDIRFIAATNRNLTAEIEAGQFRKDLFYRLAGFGIRLPALRERTEDLSLLSDHFGRQAAQRLNRKPIQISSEALQAMKRYPWPGNIRELKNVLERSLILMEGDTLERTDLPAEIAHSSDGTTLSAFSMAAAEKLHIQRVLNHTQGNKAEAARLLQIGIATLYRKIEGYGLETF
ncbi:MAG: sigma-54-dependent Fis family transcriptional regulator [Sphingobacteriales bacterium]|nr:MAG: sigma-54-dependent Fis family transcriptional regulator [Sphingobacteriales bacterium]